MPRRTLYYPFISLACVASILWGSWILPLIAGMVGCLVMKDPVRVWTRPVNIALLGLALVAMLSQSWSTVPFMSLLGGCQWLACAFATAALSGWMERKQARRQILSAAVLLYGGLVAWVIGSSIWWYLQWPIYLGWGRPLFPLGYRFFGLHGPTQTSALLAVGWIFWVHAFPRHLADKFRLTFLFGMVAGILALVMVDSRGGWLALGAGVFLWSNRGGATSGTIKRGMWIASALAGSLILVLRWLPVTSFNTHSLGESHSFWLDATMPMIVLPVAGWLGSKSSPYRLRRLMAALLVVVPILVTLLPLLRWRDGLQFLSSGRMGFWQVAWGGFFEHPIHGNGVWSFSRTYLKSVGMTVDFLPMHAHNIALEVMTSLGLLGLTALVVMVCLVAFSRKKTSLAACGLMVIWIHSAFDVPAGELLGCLALLLALLPPAAPRRGVSGVVLARTLLIGVPLVAGAYLMDGHPGAPAFENGLESWKHGRLGEALLAWDSAGKAEPSNALYARTLLIGGIQAEGPRAPIPPRSLDSLADVVLAAEPWNPWVILALGKRDLMLGNAASADNRFREFLRRWPDRRVEWARFRLWLALGQHDSATAIWGRVHNRLPGQVQFAWARSLGVSVDGNEGSVQTENDPWLKRTADEIRQGALDRARKSLVVSWLTKPPYEAELFQNHRDSLRELLRLSPEEMFRFGVTLDRVHGGMKIVELQAYGQNGPRWENVVEFSPVRE